MLLAGLGLAYDEATIAQKCGTTALGCTVQDMVQGARSFGLNAALLGLRDQAGAVAALSNQAPFVAMIDLAALDSSQPLFSWHFVVPLGATQGEAVFHDPVEGPDRRAKLDEFLAAWATAAYLGVRVWTP
jgi:ABC-type bacteriocin/lantibiotic exporter with double-glycine peptidase domain